MPFYTTVRLHASPDNDGPIKRGARLAAWFGEYRDGGVVVHDVVATDIDGRALPPGATATVTLVVIDPELWPDLHPGARFEFHTFSFTGNWAEVVGPLAEADQPGDIAAP